MSQREKTLKENLYILDPTLQNSLLNVRGQLYGIMRWDILDLNQEETRTFNKFNED